MKNYFWALFVVFPFLVYGAGESLKDTSAKADTANISQPKEKTENSGEKLTKDSMATDSSNTASALVRFGDITCLPGMVGIKAKVGFFKKERKYCIDVYEFPNTLGKFPLTQVTWNEARQYCSDHGKRLCSDKEWMAACQGAGSLKYPYGAKYEKEKCVTEAKYYVKVSSKENCVSAYGVYDMSGNVWEWTAGGGVVTFGGAWDDGKSATCKNWKARAIDAKDNSIGFRCCMDGK